MPTSKAIPSQFRTRDYPGESPPQYGMGWRNETFSFPLQRWILTAVKSTTMKILSYLSRLSATWRSTNPYNWDHWRVDCGNWKRIIVFSTSPIEPWRTQCKPENPDSSTNAECTNTRKKIQHPARSPKRRLFISSCHPSKNPVTSRTDVND